MFSGRERQSGGKGIFGGTNRMGCVRLDGGDAGNGNNAPATLRIRHTQYKVQHGYIDYANVILWYDYSE